MFGHNDSMKNYNPDPSMMADPPMSSTTSSVPALTPAPPIPEPEPETDDKEVSNPISAPPKENKEEQANDKQPAVNFDPTTPASIPSANNDSLLDIKQKALGQLAPLVDTLDQNPEEKFQTTMMMIQANDNQKLLSVAYQTAQNITDDKKRAQALLDVINEVNYFLQQSSK
jgi:hypothetical protein